ncbi:Vanin-like protein 1, partial [Armadillidium vulgare]
CLHFCIFNVVASDAAITSNLDLESPEHSNSSIKENRVRYIGAVLEYEPFSKWSEEGKEYRYNHSPRIWKQSLSMFNFVNNTENFLTFTQYVPDPSLRMVVCDQEEEPNSKYESNLSLAPRKQLISPCHGVTKFRKIALKKDILFTMFKSFLIEKEQLLPGIENKICTLKTLFTPGPQNDKEAIFITDFNVAFSLQICFDILFEHPGYANSKNYGIRDVAMSTAWGDMLPFYLAIGVQNGFSRGLGVNLLVSGYHRPDKGNLGSGIYKGYPVDDLSLYSFDANSGNVLLVSTVETVAASSLNLPISDWESEENVRNYTSHPIDIKVSLKKFNDLKTFNRPHIFKYEDLSQYTKVLLESSNIQKTSKSIACSHDNFCCTLNYKYSGNQT